jgi:hypothetical protein
MTHHEWNRQFCLGGAIGYFVSIPIAIVAGWFFWAWFCIFAGTICLALSIDWKRNANNS